MGGKKKRNMDGRGHFTRIQRKVKVPGEDFILAKVLIKLLRLDHKMFSRDWIFVGNLAVNDSLVVCFDHVGRNK
jgi:hypothetical protein